MKTFFQPVLSTLIGLCMGVYGLIHAFVRYPGTAGFDAFLDSIPSVMAVMIFVIGLLAIAVGVALLVTGIRGIRRRMREIERAYGSSPRYREYGDYEADGHYR